MPNRPAKRKKKRPPTPARFAERLKAVRSRLRDAELDALLVVHPPDTRYLTGFHGEDSWCLVPARGRSAHLISDSRFTVQIARDAPHAVTHIRTGPISEVVEKVFAKAGWARLGLQPAYTTITMKRAVAKRIGARKLQEKFDDGLLAQRSVKTDDEARAIVKAIRVQEQAFADLLPGLVPGRTEGDVAGELEHRMKALGAEAASFPSIVASDANAALPHAVPGRRKLKRDGLVLIDWGARVDGYCGDLTRVVGLGGMPKKMREVYRVVLDAQLAAIDAIRPGVEAKDVDAAARRVIDDAGYGDEFGHGTGHGIGLEVHEGPTLGKKSKGPLEPGHVVTVEPGVYLPGVGGVRIEDDVLVTERGAKVLSRLPKDLDAAII